MWVASLNLFEFVQITLIFTSKHFSCLKAKSLEKLKNVKTHVIASEDERNLHKSLFDKDKYNPRVIQGKGQQIVRIKQGNSCQLV